MFKPILALCAGALFCAAVFAADDALRDDHPDTYVVQKGDTLWDIAGRFLNHPWLWPEIWQANPQIENPHLIYPGDVLTLVYSDGRARVTLESGFGPRIRAESLVDAVTAIPLADVLPFLERLRVLDGDEAERLPYIVAMEENRLRATEGQLAYIRGLDVAPGTRVLIVRPTYKYYDVPAHFPWETAERKTLAKEWHADRHQTLGTFWEKVAVNRAYRRHVDYLGHEVMEIAQGEVLRTGDPTTVLVTLGDMEVKKGDLVMLGGSAPFDLTFFPRPPDSVPDNMRVMAFADALNAVGPKQVVALNKGARDGIENGQVFSIFHPGDVITDDVQYADTDLRTIFNKRKAKVELPEEFVGHVMVFRTFERLSYGLVMDGIRPVHLGDNLHEPVR